MLANPHPTELMKLIPMDCGVEQYRNVFCDHYDGCLDEAITRGWTSFTCASCLLFAARSRAMAVESCGAAA